MRMLDLRFVRENADRVRKALADRGLEVPLDELLEKDRRRRAVLTDLEEKRARHKRGSKEVGERVRRGEDPAVLREEMAALSEEIGKLEKEADALEAAVRELLARLPNIPHESVPVGPDETYNREVRRWGQPPAFGFQPLPHWELGEQLGILDFQRGVKIAEEREPSWRER
jgi:seryl-tRNA synthetase